jgi:hypothetical protein
VNEPLCMNDAKRDDEPPHVAREYDSQSRRVVVPGDTLAPLAQRLPDPLQNNPEIIIVFDELQHIHYDLMRACI